ncbi:DUF721 domain-containing protein [Dysgonomonas sp. 216]|uniref:DUF721 domain-containing protein n=1 Tax=Dysgonomonas sp. 216 TaxID=2302934 RepID=UPI0013D63E43|nr:DUF721 domain-containing protein [Dysgonomonas sp. 216]NDW19614.1 DUF721 domain-containing protein [Dysgonomonas sp. 216]
MRKKNTESIGDVLKQFFEENQFIKRKIAENRIISGWAKLFGPAIASYTSNLYLNNNILYVHLTSSVLRSELIMSKERMITALNKYAGMDIVNNIIFR